MILTLEEKKRLQAMLDNMEFGMSSFERTVYEMVSTASVQEEHRCGRIIHVKAGNETFSPTHDDMEALADMFARSDADDFSAIASQHGVEVSVVELAQDDVVVVTNAMAGEELVVRPASRNLKTAMEQRISAVLNHWAHQSKADPKTRALIGEIESRYGDSGATEQNVAAINKHIQLSHPDANIVARLEGDTIALVPDTRGGRQ